MADEWYAILDDQQAGPFSAAEILAHARMGHIGPETYVRRGVAGKWLHAKKVGGLKGAIGARSAGPGPEAPASPLLLEPPPARQLPVPAARAEAHPAPIPAPRDDAPPAPHPAGGISLRAATLFAIIGITCSLLAHAGLIARSCVNAIARFEKYPGGGGERGIGRVISMLALERAPEIILDVALLAFFLVLRSKQSGRPDG